MELILGLALLIALALASAAYGYDSRETGPVTGRIAR